MAGEIGGLTISNQPPLDDLVAARAQLAELRIAALSREAARLRGMLVCAGLPLPVVTRPPALRPAERAAPPRQYRKVVSLQLAHLRRKAPRCPDCQGFGPIQGGRNPGPARPGYYTRICEDCGRRYRQVRPAKPKEAS